MDPTVFRNSAGPVHSWWRLAIGFISRSGNNSPIWKSMYIQVWLLIRSGYTTYIQIRKKYIVANIMNIGSIGLSSLIDFGPALFTSCFLSSSVEIHAADTEKSKMCQPIRGQGGHICKRIATKSQIQQRINTEYLLPVNFQMIRVSRPV